MTPLYRLLRLWPLLLALIAVPTRAAEPVTATETRELPRLPDLGEKPVLTMLGGAPVALTRDRAVMLSAAPARWVPIDARALAGMTVLADASDGARAAVLTGRGPRLIERTGARLVVRALPPLPAPLASPRVTFDGGAILVAGVAGDGRPRLFRAVQPGAAWSERTVWPGGGAPVDLVAQVQGLYAMTGGPDGQALWRWTERAGWSRRTAAPVPVVPDTARPVSQANLLFVAAGADGEGRLYAYSTITDAWTPIGAGLGQVVKAIARGDGLLTLANDRSVRTTELRYQRRPLSPFDWGVVGVYLAGMLAIGGWFWWRSRTGSTSEFFLGSRAIPFWAAGVSMFATNTSSISYLAVPAKAFDTDWQYMMSKIVTFFGLLLCAFWIVPLFRRLNLVSVFSYLETRFHPAIRMLSSALAILMHVGGRMGIVLFLPALAIGTITGTSVVACILVIGLCTIVYTALGGMKAVVWTDFFQVVVLMSGALFAIGFIVHAVGLAPILDTAARFDKTRLVNLSFDFTTPTLWGFLILIGFDTVLTFPKDQVLMQRALATPSAKAAGRSIWVFAAILLPAGLVFYVIGTLLFAYYRAFPMRLDPLLPVDAVFPAFIGGELPHGVTGVIIAGLFAAAMGTLSGTINSVATLLSVDFYEKLRATPPTQKQSVRFAEAMTVLTGVVGVGIAIVLSRLDVRSLLDLTIELFGLLGGSCAGAYSLGMFTTRANWQGTAIGIVAASLITLVAWVLGLVHPYFYLAIAIVSSIAIGYVASFLFPPPTRDQLDGLTVFTGGGGGGGGRERADLEPERVASTSIS